MYYTATLKLAMKMKRRGFYRDAEEELMWLLIQKYSSLDFFFLRSIFSFYSKKRKFQSLNHSQGFDPLHLQWKRKSVCHLTAPRPFDLKNWERIKKFIPPFEELLNTLFRKSQIPARRNGRCKERVWGGTKIITWSSSSSQLFLFPLEKLNTPLKSFKPL